MLIIQCFVCLVLDEHIGFQVIRMIATDADADAVLRYRFVPGTQIAYDGQGASVSLRDFDFTVSAKWQRTLFQ